jgi:hypothetical protein
MRNTNAIIESICNNTTFHPALKAGLKSLLESNVDIIYWNALNEAEDNAVHNSFKSFSSGVTGDLAQYKQAPSSIPWVQNNKIDLSFLDGKDTESEEGLKKHIADKYRWAENPYRNLDVIDREESIADDAKIARATQDNYADIIAKTEKTVGIQNIKNYLEKISSDVQTFVKLVTLLTDQIIKEAWVKAPETIASVFGKRLYFLEAPALAIRNQNIDSFLDESAILLQLAEDLSVYFVLQNANNEIKKSIEDIWDNVEKKSKEKVNKTDVPEPVKNVLLLQENFITMFENAVWDIIPILIEEHGNDFFLIIESDGGSSENTIPTNTSTPPQNVKTLFDAFNSSRFQAYNPIFETMYQELSLKKPFNWLLDLEEKLVDDNEIEKNLSYCGATMVQQGLATKNDFTLPTIGKISGITAHKLVQMSYKTEDGLSKLLKVKESLWITSSFVPGTYGLTLLLLNVACGVMFVAYAEDIVGFDISKVYPKFTNLPIWKIFREGVLDLKQEYANKQDDTSSDALGKPDQGNTPAKTGIKFNN